MLHNRMLKVKNVGKPDEGKPHVRFDEEGQASLPFTLLSTYLLYSEIIDFGDFNLLVTPITNDESR